MVDPSTIGLVFAIIGVVATMVWFGLALVGIRKVDDLREGLGESEQRAVGSDADQAPLETARERYARGETTEEEFERMAERLLETDQSAGTEEPAFERE